ncbi:hypothetical protein ABK040_013647 [Willaertia magna]
MRNLLILTLLITIALQLVLAEPPVFPGEYSALAYDIEGILSEQHNNAPALIKIYNSWSRLSKRVDYQFMNQPFYTQIHTGNTLYEIHAENRTCIVTELGFPPLPPNWLQTATYTGIQKVNGILCETWVRDSSTFWRNAEDKSPVKVNESNFFVWNYIPGSFVAGSQPNNLFTIPSYCKKALKMKSQKIKG